MQTSMGKHDSCTNPVQISSTMRRRRHPLRICASEEILAAQHRHGARHRRVHPRERVRRFHLVGVLVRGDGVRRMRERMRAAEVRSSPYTAEAELSDQLKWSNSALCARPGGGAKNNSRDGRSRRGCGHGVLLRDNRVGFAPRGWPRPFRADRTRESVDELDALSSINNSSSR